MGKMIFALAFAAGLAASAQFSSGPGAEDHYPKDSGFSSEIAGGSLLRTSTQELSPKHSFAASGSLADIIEASTPAVVQVRVQKAPGTEESEDDDSAALLDFLRKFGVPSQPDKNGPKKSPLPDEDQEALPPKKNKEPESKIPFPKPPAKPPQNAGVGSGFFIDPSGYVLTNAHVVEGAQKILLRMFDEREIEAKLIGMDKRTDIALLKAEAPAGQTFKALPIGNSDKSRVGDLVVAIGSPFGLEFTATMGIVSAKGRALPSDEKDKDKGYDNYVPFLQTDAAVNPGNSGGPLINQKGQAIGVNSQIYSKSGGYMGISFAIPIDYAVKIASKIRKNNGAVVHGRIGVTIQPLSQELASAFDLQGRSGAIITSVEPDSPADKAGILPADIVIGVERKPISGSQELIRLIADGEPGDTLALEVQRKGARVALSVTLGAPKPESAEKNKDPKSAPKESKKSKPESFSKEPFGIKGRPLNAREAKAANLSKGFKVIESNGLAEAGGIAQDDILVSVNNKPVGSLEEISRAIEEAPAGKPFALLVRRGKFDTYVAISLEN